MEFAHRPYVPEETIAAIATPPGEGGIAIVRISGKDSFAVGNTIFSGDISSYSSHTAHLGKILDSDGGTIDEALLLVMKGPRSFTGEDTVEIHCHGGSFVTRKVLERALEAGARAALPGEFTFKAFMNGKIDLTKAEAIGQVIGAKNELAHLAAENHLSGALSTKILAMQKKLFDIAAILEASVDFPEESLEFASKDEILEDLTNTLDAMQSLSNTFFEGKIVHEGFSLSLIGPPNAGKSSLMNALLGKERAIVTEIAGTTRDLLEDNLYLGGLHFKLVDTAGIRETGERVEKEGIKKSKEAMAAADLVLFILDASKALCSESASLIGSVPKEKTLLVWNKIDLPKFSETVDHPFPEVSLSAATGEGLDLLKKQIESFIWKKGPPDKNEVILTSIRHKQALDTASSLLSSVIEGIKTDVSPEFLSFDMRKCLFELGTILGVNISEEILNSIFAKFCIGK